MGTGHLKIHSTNITPDALICPNDKPVVSSSVVPSVLATVRPTSNVYTGAALIILLLFLAIPATESQKTHRLFWDDKNPVLIEEVAELEKDIAHLQRRYADAIAEKKALVRRQLDLEEEIQIKQNSLFLDEVECMGIRQSIKIDAY